LGTCCGLRYDQERDDEGENHKGNPLFNLCPFGFQGMKNGGNVFQKKKEKHLEGGRRGVGNFKQKFKN